MNDGRILIVKDFEIFYRLFSVFLVVASDDQLHSIYLCQTMNDRAVMMFMKNILQMFAHDGQNMGSEHRFTSIRI